MGNDRVIKIQGIPSDLPDFVFILPNGTEKRFKFMKVFRDILDYMAEAVTLDQLRDRWGFDCLALPIEEDFGFEVIASRAMEEVLSRIEKDEVLKKVLNLYVNAISRISAKLQGIAEMKQESFDETKENT